jgi:hypothetical protein
MKNENLVLWKSINITLHVKRFIIPNIDALLFSCFSTEEAAKKNACQGRTNFWIFKTFACSFSMKTK